jgi:hypothetical protein
MDTSRHEVQPGRQHAREWRQARMGQVKLVGQAMVVRRGDGAAT